MKNPILIILALLVSSSFASGQSIGPSVVNSSGGSATVGGISHSWSIGEMVLVSTVSTGNLVITQGVLQPNGGFTTSVTNPKLQVSSLVYPNPAVDMVQLKTTSAKSGNLTYALMDMTGKVIVKQDIALNGGESIQSISLQGLAAGTYTLQVGVMQQGEMKSTSYKIQKIQ